MVEPVAYYFIQGHVINEQSKVNELCTIIYQLSIKI